MILVRICDIKSNIVMPQKDIIKLMIKIQFFIDRLPISRLLRNAPAMMELKNAHFMLKDQQLQKLS